MCNREAPSRAEVMDWVGREAVSREGGGAERLAVVSREGAGAARQQVRASWLNNAVVWLGWVLNC